MRRAAKVDLNQQAIVKALREIGVSVQPLHMVGKGCPDLAAAYHGVSFFLEVKTGNAKLTKDEQEWISKWNADVYIVRTPEEAQLAAIKAAGL